ncbi:MAG: metallophosphoesterase, partial [Planctomycetota bacterium]|nr:metallophosphoesterase [Planctomycetota bacterium]
ALKNAAADKPAFHIDLGDTFMTDKRRDFHEAAAQYDAQRYYLSALCDQVPLYMVLGNHDGETGTAITGRNGGEPMAPWSYAMRTSRFPSPNIGAGSMYTGRTALEGTKGSHYYAFEWPTNFGSVQIIALDPFWMTTQRPRGGPNGGGGGGEGGNANTDQNWMKTLGKEQYDWLEQTLTASKAPYRFVFIHHLVGGFGKDSRGGMESSVFFEWGGQNADGSPGFATNREGWTMPIHDLLVKHGVNAVFHGHDHLYVHAERDGLIYQCVPQPGNSQGGTRSSADYGYKSGTVLGSPGYLRVTIDKAAAKVEFVRSSLGDDAPERRREREANGAVVRSYEIKPNAHSSGR